MKNKQNKDLIYQYPIEDFKSFFEETFKKSTEKNRKSYLNSIAFFLLATSGFLVYSFFPSIKISKFLFLASIVFLIISFVILSSTAKKSSPHQLSIDAYDDEMILTYYSDGRYFKRTLHICYEDVISARFSDNDYTSFQIAFKESEATKLISYDKNGSIINNSMNNLFLFKLNPYSYEQGFFLYYANNFFKINGFNDGKKVEKRYGDSEKYFSKIDNEGT